MNQFYDEPFTSGHSHVFLGAGHEKNERKTWAVIALCSAMMIAEIAGGSLFGSLALVADGLHMSTHAGAMLIAAMAYTYARQHANDNRFVFGTGKLGDLAGFTSAIILAFIALLIGYEAVLRFMSPVAIHFNQAIPIAVVGLGVNVASALLLSGGEHHGHSHGHGHAHAHPHPLVSQPRAGYTQVASAGNTLRVATSAHTHVDTAHGMDARDHNLRAAYVHVIADAAVSVLAIVGLLLARAFGWLWMDPLAGLVGALVIANWAYGLLRDTGAILLDVAPAGPLKQQLRRAVSGAGDQLLDLHVWRLGPGHYGAVLSVRSSLAEHSAAFYHARLAALKGLSHLTVEVLP